MKKRILSLLLILTLLLAALPAGAITAGAITGTPIETIELTLTRPPVGKTTAEVSPQVSVPAGAGYTVADAVWIDSLSKEPLTHPLTFTAGEECCLLITVESEPGYYCPQGPSGTGVTVTGGDLYSHSISNFMNEQGDPHSTVEVIAGVLPDAPGKTLIDNVTVTVTPPAAGTAATDAKPLVRIETEGITDDFYAHLQSNTDHTTYHPETIELTQGETYYIHLVLYAAEGFTFAKGKGHTLDVDACDCAYGGSLSITGGAPCEGRVNVRGSANPEYMVVWIAFTAAEAEDHAGTPEEDDPAPMSYIHVLSQKGGTAEIDYEGYQGEDQPYAVPDGAEVTLFASPASGYRFKGWYQGDVNASSYDEMFTDELLSTANPYTFKATGYPYVCAKFEYTGVSRQGDQIEVWTTDGGKISVTYAPKWTDDAYIKAKDGKNYVSPGEIVPFWQGDAVTVNAKAEQGFVFKGWYRANMEWGPGEGQKYVGNLLSAKESFTYMPGKTVPQGEKETLRAVCAVFEKQPAVSVLPGDVDGNGKVNASDARLALRAAVRLEDFYKDPNGVKFRAADVDKNKKITAADARKILRAAVKLEVLT